MRLRKLVVQGVTSFESTVTIDFDAIGPGVIAFAGPNGSGKTTLLECSGPGIGFCELPSRAKSPDVRASPLAEWVGPKGGEVREWFAIGEHEYDAHVKFTAGGSAKGFLTRDGEPQVSGKIGEYKKAMARLLGKPEAFYASEFAVQEGRHKFGSLGVADRKELFAFYLDLGRIQRAHKIARDRLNALDTSAIDRAEGELRELERRLADAEQRLRDARSRLPALREGATTAQARADAVAEQAALAELVDEFDAAAEDFAIARERLSAARERLERNPAPEGTAPDADAAQQGVDRAREDARHARTLIADEDAAEDRLLGARSALEDATRRAAVVERVPCRGAGEFAACEFLREGVEACGKLKSLRKAVAGAEVEVERAAQDREAFEPASVDDALAKLRAVQRERDDWHTAQARHERARDAVDAAREAVASARERARQLKARLPDPVPDDLPTLDDVDRLRRAARDAARALEDAVREEERAASAVEHVQGQIKAATDRLRAARAKAAEADDLRLLVRALGPNGVQALEIHAAGPRVSDLTNDLLAACYGDRFVFELRTLRDKKDGDGVVETFEPWIIDSDARRAGAGPLNRYSGGERVVLDEAFRTSLSLFGRERRTSTIETLWRDEPAGALDAENAPRYTAMLKRARELGGFYQVLYVTHDPLAIEAADAVVRLDMDGNVWVER